MSFEKCILNSVENKIISETQAKQMINEFNELSKSNDYATSWQKIINSRAKKNKDFARSLAIHTKKRKEFKEQMDEMSSDKERKRFLNTKIKNASTGAKTHNTNFLRVLNQGFENKGIFNNKAEDFLPAIRSIIDGVQTDNKTANQIASNIKDALKVARSNARKFGMILGDLGDKYYPQVYDRRRVHKMSEENFVKLMLDNLDLRGEKQEDMIKVLKAAKVQIETDGLDSNTFDAVFGIAEKRNLARKFHFKNGESYLRVMSEIGAEGGDPRKILQNYFYGISQDISIADELGPLGKDLIVGFGNRFKNSPLFSSNLLANYNIVAGAAFDGDRNSALYRSHNGLQLWQRAAHLGSAVVAALSDTTFNASVHRLNGGGVLKIFNDYAKVLTARGGDLEKTAKDMGYYFEIYSGTLLDENRFSVGGDGKGFLKTLSDTSFKVSGLSYFTRMGKIIAEINANHLISDLVKKKTEFKKLSPVLKERLDDIGIDEARWNKVLENLDIRSDGRKNFFNSSELRAKSKQLKDDDELYGIADDLDTFVFKMSELATNENNIDTRSVTSGAWFSREGKVGTGGKVTAETLFQYKNFPFSVLLNHTLPAIRRFKKGLDLAVKKGEITEGFRLMSELGFIALGTTIIGATVVQLKNPLKGKSFQDIDEKLLLAGAMQGGGFGIFGDFLFQDNSRFGNTLSATALGPTVSTLEDIKKIFKGSTFDKLIRGEPAEFDRVAKGAAKLLRRNTPIASSLWYTRLATERLIFDSIDNMIDPRAFRRRIRKRRRQMAQIGQDYWWNPESSLPKIEQIASD